MSAVQIRQRPYVSQPDQTTHPYSCIATTLPGLEETLQRELASLGAGSPVIGRQSVHFNADRTLLYRANLELRTALRVLVRTAAFAAATADDLYRKAVAVPWERYLTPQMTIAVRATGNFPTSDDPRFAALKVKDAVVDRLRKRYGRRPDVNVKNPDLQLNLYWDTDGAVLSLDSSLESLHRRGYRSEQTAAPMSEVLAAGLVALSGWDGVSTLYNPMCGSGTIAIEAALKAADVAPGLLQRRFGFQSWRDYDADLWQTLHQEAQQRAQRGVALLRVGEGAGRGTGESTGGSGRAAGLAPGRVVAGDIEPAAVRIAVRNLERTGFADLVRVVRRDFLHDAPPAVEGPAPVLLMNPPYGKRLAEPEIDQLYVDIGERLKASYAGWNAWIISGNRDALKRIGLRTSRRLTLFNGPIECSFRGYSLY